MGLYGTIISKKIILSTTFFEEFEYLDNLSTYLLNEQGGKFPKSTTQQFFNCNKANNNLMIVSDWQNFIL